VLTQEEIHRANGEIFTRWTGLAWPAEAPPKTLTFFGEGKAANIERRVNSCRKVQKMDRINKIAAPPPSF